MVDRGTMKKLYLSIIIPFALIACSHTKPAIIEDQVKGPSVITNVSAGKNEVVDKADIDGDGKPDAFIYYKKDPKTGQRILLRKEVDLNGDGKIDLIKYYDAKGNSTKDEMDLDFDGKIDRIVKYKNNKVYMVLLSSGFDGRFDIKQFFDKGKLVLIKRSTKKNGVFDEFQYFVKGRLVRIGWDRDGDGQPEVFKDNPTVQEF